MSTGNSPVLSTNATKSIENLAKLHPNPNNGSFSIQLPANVDIQNVKVINVAGNQLESNLDLLSNKVTLSNPSNGLYFVEIKTNKGVITKKVVVNN